MVESSSVWQPLRRKKNNTSYNINAMIAIVNTHPINAWLHVDLKIDSNVRIHFEMQSQVIREAPKFSVNFSFCPLICYFVSAVFFVVVVVVLLLRLSSRCCYLWIYLSRNRNKIHCIGAFFTIKFRNCLWNLMPILLLLLLLGVRCGLDWTTTSTEILSSYKVLPLLTKKSVHKFHTAHTLFERISGH